MTIRDIRPSDETILQLLRDLAENNDLSREQEGLLAFYGITKLENKVAITNKCMEVKSGVNTLKLGETKAPKKPILVEEEDEEITMDDVEEMTEPSFPVAKVQKKPVLVEEEDEEIIIPKIKSKVVKPAPKETMLMEEDEDEVVIPKVKAKGTKVMDDEDDIPVAAVQQKKLGQSKINPAYASMLDID
jgi:hypothetical protein